MESRITCISCDQIFSVSPYSRAEVRCPACRQLNRLYPGVDGKFSTASSIGGFLSKTQRKISGSSSHHLKIDTSPLPLASSSSQYLRKRAVLCGVSYKNCKHKLKGTVNDAMNMKHCLKHHFDFHTDQIRLLTGTSVKWYYLTLITSENFHMLLLIIYYMVVLGKSNYRGN